MVKVFTFANAPETTDLGNEGWNASLNEMFTKQHPPMSKFLIIIIREEERTRNLVNR